MQWVETTGSTVDEAKEAALDQLGIDSSEAEFEILEEPKTGLFGRIRGTARVRARVVPKSPRPKQERRPRKSRSSGGDETKGSKPSPKPKSGAPAGSGSGDASPERASGGRTRTGSRSGGRAATNQEGNKMSDEAVSVDEQADIISEFLEGLLAALAIEGTVNRTKVDDTTVELGVEGGEGSDLGILIGPKGQTLTAVHELSRTVLQRRATGRHDGRVRIDIGGYRQRRAEALARFVRAQAEAVVAEGVSRALEPMNAVDRKIVHDTINEIDGVSTLSEGVDPNRRVVIVVEGSDG